MKISVGTRWLCEKVHLVHLPEFPLWKDWSRKQITIFFKISWRWRPRSSQACPYSHAEMSSFILEPMMFHSQYIKLTLYGHLSDIMDAILSEIKYSWGTHRQDNMAVTVLKIIRIFICSSYFHHAADISPLLGLFYDNPEFIKLLSNDINLRILFSNAGWLLTLKLTVSVQ